MYNFEQFKNSNLSLVIVCHNEPIFQSDAGAITPLIDFINSEDYNKYSGDTGQLIIYDKYIGRAAALLMILINPTKVCTPLISQFGREVFEKYQIVYEADAEVKYLMGVASEDMCHWEKMTVGKTPEEFWTMLNK